MAVLDMQELKAIIEIALDRELLSLAPNVHLYEELGMDSIGAVAMIVEIQRRCRVRIDEKDIPDLTTPQSLLDYVNRIEESAPT